jgi:hypothetical protein
MFNKCSVWQGKRLELKIYLDIAQLFFGVQRGIVILTQVEMHISLNY